MKITFTETDISVYVRLQRFSLRKLKYVDICYLCKNEFLHGKTVKWGVDVKDHDKVSHYSVCELCHKLLA